MCDKKGNSEVAQFFKKYPLIQISCSWCYACGKSRHRFVDPQNGEMESCNAFLPWKFLLNFDLTLTVNRKWRPNFQIENFNQCKWRYQVTKLVTNVSDAILWPNLELVSIPTWWPKLDIM